MDNGTDITNPAKPHASHISRWLSNAGLAKHSSNTDGFICCGSAAHDGVAIWLGDRSVAAGQVVAILAAHGWTATITTPHTLTIETGATQ